jgi:hypothetical protein
MANPANSGEEKGKRKRIPLSTPQLRLEVPEIPGYKTYWFREINVPRALQAWYTFVDEKEIPLNQRGIGTDTQISGSNDLGSNVSITHGVDEKGNPDRLVLMKIQLEYWLEDQKTIAERNASTLETIFRGEKILTESGERADDQNARYVDPDRTSFRGRALFQRPVRKTAR